MWIVRVENIHFTGILSNDTWLCKNKQKKEVILLKYNEKNKNCNRFVKKTILKKVFNKKICHGKASAGAKNKPWEARVFVLVDSLM